MNSMVAMTMSPFEMSSMQAAREDGCEFQLEAAWIESVSPGSSRASDAEMRDDRTRQMIVERDDHHPHGDSIGCSELWHRTASLLL